MVDPRWLVDLAQEDSVQEDFHLVVDFLLVVDFHLEILDSVLVDSQEDHLGEVSPHLVVVCHPVDLVALVDFLREALQVSHSVEAMVVEITVLIKLSRVLKTGSKLK